MAPALIFLLTPSVTYGSSQSPHIHDSSYHRSSAAARSFHILSGPLAVLTSAPPPVYGHQSSLAPTTPIPVAGPQSSSVAPPPVQWPPPAADHQSSSTPPGRRSPAKDRQHCIIY